MLEYASYLQLCIRRFEEALVPQVLFCPEGNAGISQHLIQLLLILDACKVASLCTWHTCHLQIPGHVGLVLAIETVSGQTW